MKLVQLGVSPIGGSPNGGSPIGGSPNGGGPSGGQFSNSFYLLQQTNISSNKIKWIQMIMSIVHLLLRFRRSTFNCDFGKPLLLWRNVTQTEPGTLCIWALSYWTVTKAPGLPTVSCQCRSAQPMLCNFRWTNLQLHRWCCVAPLLYFSCCSVGPPSKELWRWEKLFLRKEATLFNNRNGH